MLVDLGQRVYVDDFEVHFLAAASDFYKVRPPALHPPPQVWCTYYGAHASSCCTAQVEAQEYLNTSDCPEYLRKAEKRLAEEAERVAAYLDASSEAKITAVVETELISNQVGNITPLPLSSMSYRFFVSHATSFRIILLHGIA
jgi:cullin 3